MLLAVLVLTLGSGLAAVGGIELVVWSFTGIAIGLATVVVTSARE